MPQRPMSINSSGTVLSLHLRSSSVCSSLASPGDSGVAFDSDMDLANETDASSYKEVSSLRFKSELALLLTTIRISGRLFDG